MKNVYYGIVEGFFSKPLPIWTYEERLETLDFIHQYAPYIDTYFYCPKDEPYVTKRWDQLYPTYKQAELIAYMQRCAQYNVNFVYGLNPSIQENVDWQSITLKMIKKIDHIISLGCRNICLLFDDIPIAYDVVDNMIQVSDIYDELITCIQTLHSTYQNKIDDFWVCMPDYVFIRDTPLTKACKRLPKDIGIIWSGNAVFSKNVTNKDIERVRKMLFPEVRLLYWSNYPVNDCEQALGTFNLGGFYPIKCSAARKLSGILVNPMREPYANLPFYITFSDFIRDGSTYSRKVSWERSIRNLGLSNDALKQITLFSSVNINDISKKCTYRELLRFKPSPPKVSTIWGTQLVKAIKQIFDDAQLYRSLSESIVSNEPINGENFQKWDWFPTKTYVPRYLAEIVSILQTRYTLYKRSIIKEDNPLLHEKTITKYIQQKYSGQKKLAMSLEDTALIARCIDDAIRKERNSFIEFLERTDTTADRKLSVLYARRNVNRFNSSTDL